MFIFTFPLTIQRVKGRRGREFRYSKDTDSTRIPVCLISGVESRRKHRCTRPVSVHSLSRYTVEDLRRNRERRGQERSRKRTLRVHTSTPCLTVEPVTTVPSQKSQFHLVQTQGFLKCPVSVVCRELTYGHLQMY